MKTWWCAAAVGFAVSLLMVSPGQAAGTSDVYGLDAFFRGVIQSVETNYSRSGGELTTNLTLIAREIQVDTYDLINFGTGRPLGTKVPKNEVLGLAHNCAFVQVRMIVYDTNTGDKLATLALIDPVLRVFDLNNLNNKKVAQYSISDVQLLPTMNPSNGLTGGQLKLTATSNTQTNNCVQTLDGNMIGTLNASFLVTNIYYTVTNDFDQVGMTNIIVLTTNTFIGVADYDVAVSKATLKSRNKKKIGTLVEEP